ncbi:MAG: hypothetical protein HY321_11485, partial [Armatimonadetes bacterium]|nr:hypothetical protein [Armatimonadota bacterium]
MRHEVIGELGRLTAEEAEKLSRRFARIAGKDVPAAEEVELTGFRLFGAPLLPEDAGGERLRLH